MINKIYRKFNNGTEESLEEVADLTSRDIAIREGVQQDFKVAQITKSNVIAVNMPTSAPLEFISDVIWNFEETTGTTVADDSDNTNIGNHIGTYVLGDGAINYQGGRTQLSGLSITDSSNITILAEINYTSGTYGDTIIGLTRLNNSFPLIALISSPSQTRVIISNTSNPYISHGGGSVGVTKQFALVINGTNIKFFVDDFTTPKYEHELSSPLDFTSTPLDTFNTGGMRTHVTSNGICKFHKSLFSSARSFTVNQIKDFFKLGLSKLDYAYQYGNNIRINISYLGFNVTSLNWERSDDGGSTWSSVTLIQINTSCYEDQNVIAGTSYHYRASGTDGIFISPYTNSVSADVLIGTIVLPDEDVFTSGDGASGANRGDLSYLDLQVMNEVWFMFTVPSGITSATLRLNVYGRDSDGNGNYSFNVDETQLWDESTITGDNEPAVISANVGTISGLAVVFNQRQTVDIPLSGLSGNTQISIRLDDPIAPISGRGIRMDSIEATNPAPAQLIY